jgi:hypothetical protein
MQSISCPTGAFLDTWCRHQWAEGLQLDGISDLETVKVHTVNSTYEITIVARDTGEVLVRGGRFFPEFTPARLAGSSLGGSFLKRRGIYVGFRLELQCEQHTIVTSHVQAIGISAQSTPF